MTRKLLSVRRTVSEPTLTRYLAAWADLRTRAGLLGARAWIFRSATLPGLHLEFIEWNDDAAAPLDDPRLRELLRALDDFGPSISESWTEPA